MHTPDRLGIFDLEPSTEQRGFDPRLAPVRRGETDDFCLCGVTAGVATDSSGITTWHRRGWWQPRGRTMWCRVQIDSSERGVGLDPHAFPEWGDHTARVDMGAAGRKGGGPLRNWHGGIR